MSDQRKKHSWNGEPRFKFKCATYCRGSGIPTFSGRTRRVSSSVSHTFQSKKTTIDKASSRRSADMEEDWSGDDEDDGDDGKTTTTDSSAATSGETNPAASASSGSVGSNKKLKSFKDREGMNDEEDDDVAAELLHELYNL